MSRFPNIYLESKGKSGKGCYEPEVGDLIAVTNGKPRCIGDINQPNGIPYVIALVQRVFKDDVIQVRSKKQIVFNGKESNNRGKPMLFVVHLVNLTPNIHIWQALHSKLDGENMKIINKVLQSDSKVINFFLHNLTTYNT